MNTSCDYSARISSISCRQSVWPACARFLVSSFLVVSSAAPASAAQQLTIGSVVLKLGEPDSGIAQRLGSDYDVQRFEGGLSIRRRDNSRTAPDIGVKTADGRIQAVDFGWGPGFSPPVEEVAGQLAQALPAKGRCDIRTVTRPQEGGVVRTLEWTCGDYRVYLVSGVWREGDATSLGIEKR